MIGKRSGLLAIAAGGLIAGTLDLLQACVLFGWGIPLAIAGGLLGRQAFDGGAGTYVMVVVGLPISFSVWRFADVPPPP